MGIVIVRCGCCFCSFRLAGWDFDILPLLHESFGIRMPVDLTSRKARGGKCTRYLVCFSVMKERCGRLEPMFRPNLLSETSVGIRALVIGEALDRVEIVQYVQVHLVNGTTKS